MLRFLEHGFLAVQQSYFASMSSLFESLPDMQAIMMVESRSGTHALLGRPKKLRTGVLTCLSGFIEQVFVCTSYSPRRLAHHRLE